MKPISDLSIVKNDGLPVSSRHDWSLCRLIPMESDLSYMNKAFFPWAFVGFPLME